MSRGRCAVAGCRRPRVAYPSGKVVYRCREHTNAAAREYLQRPSGVYMRCAYEPCGATFEATNQQRAPSRLRQHPPFCSSACGIAYRGANASRRHGYPPIAEHPTCVVAGCQRARDRKPMCDMHTKRRQRAARHAAGLTSHGTPFVQKNPRLIAHALRRRVPVSE